VPYHLDELLPTDELPARADRVVTTDLRGTDVWHRIAGLHAAVAEAVAGSGPTAVVTGDCSTALGVVAGLQRRGIDPAVVWFDAHGDLNTPESSPSGYPAGMALRMVLGEGDATVAAETGLRPVPAARVVLSDARDLDPPEADYLAISPIRRAPVAEVPVPDGPIYLHIDLDVVDPTALPGLRFPTPGGPDLATVRDAALRLLDTGRVAALNVVCPWHPGQGSAEAAGPLIEPLLAHFA
jgi:arginase